MKYIDLINNFWRFYDENKDKISPSEIVLYKVLLRYCNKIGWVNPFTINPYIMHEINPLSVNTYYKSFKKLNDIGLIKWAKGKHNVSNQSVTILKINTSVDISLNNSIDTSLKFSVVNSPTNSLVNNNKTIIPLDQETIKLLKKDDFDLLIGSSKFKKYLKDYGLKIEKTMEQNLKEDSFIIFWNEFHLITGKNKTDKNPTKKYWDKLTESEQKKAHDSIRVYFNSLDDKKYCKKARTYLSDKNFNDEFKVNGNETKISLSSDAMYGLGLSLQRKVKNGELTEQEAFKIQLDDN